MTVKESIKAFLDVLKDAILNKEFSIVKLKEYTIIVDVQGVKIEFWIANGAECFEFYSMEETQLFQFAEKDIEILYKCIMEEVTPDLKTQEKRDIQKQINRLQNKLEKIEKL